MDVARRRVLITGGASGIGAAIAAAFAREGAEILVLTLPKPAHSDELKHFAGREEATGTAEALRAAGYAIHVVEGDSAEEADVARVTQLGESLGGIDVLVCNAATNCLHPIVDHDNDLWRRVVNVNLVGPFLAIRACLPGMIRRGYGRIVSIASVASNVGIAGYSAYCASKHGLLGLQRAVAREIEGHDITINSVSPGLVDTPSAHLHLRRSAELRGISYEEALADELSSSAQARLVAPEEIADVVVFICGPQGRSIQATDLPIRGGSADRAGGSDV
jgi:NAD(P)-dependent dehydrogenase (short-subunit alcohol dehydrogenase family)